MDRMVAEHRARIQANNDEFAKEKERFYSWRLQKQQEEQKIADTVSYFVTENPITARCFHSIRPAPEEGPESSYPCLEEHTHVEPAFAA